MTSPPAPTSAPAQATVTSRRQLWIIFVGLMLSMVLSSLDQSIVNTALPQMASDLGGLAHLSWVVTAFMLCSTIANPIYGKLGDMYGRRRLLTASILIFLLASTLCGLAQSMPQLILFRALQGFGAGGLMTLSQTVISEVVSPRERGRYQGLFTSAFAVSSVSGPLIGGGLTTALSWRWVFYVNLPLGALALTLILIGLRPSRRAERHAIDYVGAALMACAATATLLLFTWAGSLFPWASLWTVGLGLAGVIFWALFLGQERRAAEPIINLALFRIRSFTIGVITTSLMAFAMMGTMVFIPLYFQLVLGFTPAAAGLLLLPQIAMMVISSILGGHLSSRLGRPKPFMIGGIALEALGLSGLALVAFINAPLPYFLGSMAILGMGMGIAMPNATVIVQNAVPRNTLGVATGTMSFIRSLGGALGVAVSAGVMSMHLNSNLADMNTSLDLHAVIEGGLNIIRTLSPALQLSIAEVFRHSIAYSFLVSGVMMGTAVLLAMMLRGTEIR